MSTFKSVMLSTLNENDTFVLVRNNVPTINVLTLVKKHSAIYSIQTKKGTLRLLPFYALVIPINKISNQIFCIDNVKSSQPCCDSQCTGCFIYEREFLQDA